MGKIFVWGLLNKDGERRKTNIIDRNAENFKIYQGWKTWIKSKVL